MQKCREAIKKYVPIFTVVSSAITLISLILLVISRNSYAFCDFINSTVSAAYRFVMAKISSILPFSIFEVLLYLLLPLAFFLIFAAVKLFRDNVARIRYVFTLLGVVLLMFSTYVLALGIPYSVTPLSYRLELPSVEVTEDNLYDTAKLLLDEANALAAKLEFDDSGASVMPYSFGELSEKISAAYSSLSEKYDFVHGYSSRVKPIATKDAMSQLHILGIYSYFTGEANINIHYPDFNIPYTAAHEFAHQRGIARENEANFIAFLVCLESDDDFIRYSAYVRLYDYVAVALYRTNKDRYYGLLDVMSDAVRGDLIADSETYERFADNLLGKISNKINDLYLKANGTEGEISYGLVTRLAVAYYMGK